MGHNRSLTDAELAAWRSFLLAHTRLTARLDAELLARCDMTSSEYEVLEHLAASPDGRLRMNELAERARLSPSGLTRRFDALAQRGWVTRERCDDDRRGVMAQLTSAGRSQLTGAEPTHAEGIQRFFLDALDDDEVTSLTAMMTRVCGIEAPDSGLSRL